MLTNQKIMYFKLKRETVKKKKKVDSVCCVGLKANQVATKLKLKSRKG